MLNFENLLNRQLMIFVLIVVGALLAKLKIVNDAGRGTLSELVLRLFMPCNVVAAFLNAPYSAALLKSFFVAMLVGFGVQFFSLGVAMLLYRKHAPASRAVYQFCTIASNAAFVGIPVVEGLFGSVGVLYVAAYLVSMNIFMWSVGLGFFEEPSAHSGIKKALLTVKKVALQPGIIGVAVGFVLMLARIHPPVFLAEAVTSVGGCTTTVSLLVVGHVMAKVKIRALFTRQILYYCAIRLVILPALTLGALLLLRPDPVVAGTLVVLVAMPAASAVVMVADRYKSDSVLASKVVSLSTAFSMLTVPLMAMLTQRLTG